MKVRASVKKMCDKCKIVRRTGVVGFPAQCGMRALRGRLAHVAPRRCASPNVPGQEPHRPGNAML